jgi:hypothetical protein
MLTAETRDPEVEEHVESRNAGAQRSRRATRPRRRFVAAAAVTLRDAVALLVRLGLNWLVVLWLFSGSASRVTIPYRPTFLTQLQQGNVASVAAQESAIDGHAQEGDPLPARRQECDRNDEVFDARAGLFGHEKALDVLLQQKGVVVKAKAPAVTPWWESLLAAVLPAVLLFPFYYWAMRKQTTGGMFSFGRAKAKQYEPTTESVTFADVAGIDDAKGGAHRDRGLPARPGEVPQARRADPSWGPPQWRAWHGQDVARTRGGRRGRRPVLLHVRVGVRRDPDP